MPHYPDYYVPHGNIKPLLSRWSKPRKRLVLPPLPPPPPPLPQYILVSGAISPNITGVYKKNPDARAYFVYDHVNSTGYIYCSQPTSNAVLSHRSQLALWLNTTAGTPLGTYPPWIGASGTAYVTEYNP